VAPPSKHQRMVEASRDQAQLAVRLYNDPAEARSFEAFIVHIHVAWLYLLHAEFARDKIDSRYWRMDGKRKLLERVDGEPKQWELAHCVRERWKSDQEPVRANLEFFIGLRNKIEHRYAKRAHVALTALLGGQAQALLLNYEEELVAQFGVEQSLATRLRFPVFIGSFTTEGEATLLKLRKQLPAALRTYIASFESNFGPAVVSDPRYELRLRVFQELAPKAGRDTLPIQYTRYDDMTDEQKAAVEAAGKKGLVVTRERTRPVVGHGLLMPKPAAAAVQELIPYVFNVSHFAAAWKALKVRPVWGAAHPEQTDDKYCVYSELHRDYGYTSAFVRKLVRECGTAEGFRALLGMTPRPKVSGTTAAATPTVDMPAKGPGPIGEKSA